MLAPRVTLTYGLNQRSLGEVAKDYWSLIKSLQTGLLLFTGMAGFVSSRSTMISWQAFLGLSGSLFLAISGSTVLNMVYDRDIDAEMQRTCQRPLPAGRLATGNVTIFGLLLSVLGVLWAIALDPLYGLVVFAGLFFDVAVYTIWLKRHTPWSIVWGGISGGMPVLAGRVLSTGRIDLLGLLLALAILFWIPTHIMTFGIKYAEDYARASVPVFANVYGVRVTRQIVAYSTVLAVMAMLAATVMLAVPWAYLYALAVLSLLMVGMAIYTTINPTPKGNMRLFKFASTYMLGAMGLMAAGGLL